MKLSASCFLLVAAVGCGSSSSQQVTNYSVDCKDIDPAPLAPVRFDGDGRPVFTWDGACGQQFAVWSYSEGRNMWGLYHVTEEGSVTQDFDGFNAIHSGITYGVVPSELRESGHRLLDEAPPATLEPGREYTAALYIGCSVGALGNDAVERTVTFTMPSAPSHDVQLMQ